MHRAGQGHMAAPHIITKHVARKTDHENKLAVNPASGAVVKYSYDNRWEASQRCQFKLALSSRPKALRIRTPPQKNELF